ncbi:MAG: glycogen-binding domain-containing protein [Gemmatimonadota bacterium]
MKTPSILFVGLVALVATAHDGADAQVVRGEISVSGGIATDQRGFRSNAITIAPSVLAAPDPRFSAGLALSGTQFGADARAVSGVGSLGTRLPLTSILALAGSASASGTTTSFNASYTSADLTPTLEATVSGVTLYAGAHVAAGRTSQRVTTSMPGGGVFGSPTLVTRDTAISRSSAGPVFGGVWNIATQRADQSAAISYREEHARVQGARVVDRVATGTLGSESWLVSASGGLRDAIGEPSGYGSVSATFAVARSVALQAAAGSYPSNLVSGTLGGRFASIGVSLRGARRIDVPVAAPRLRGAPAPQSGTTRLLISAPAAQRVEVAGDWNGWTPTPATRNPEGIWYADVALPKGEYRYAFKIDGQRWRVPEGATSIDDGFGGKSALVSVR